MFEDSLMESQNRLSSPNQRWTTALSLTLQCLLVAAIMALPLFHPEALPFHIVAPKISLHVIPLPQPMPHIEAETISNAPSATGAPSAPGAHVSHRSGLPSLNSAQTDIGDPPSSGMIGSMIGSGAFPDCFGPGTAGGGTKVSLAPSNAPIHVSTGVSAGLLLAPIVPIYPRTAIATRTEGVVKVEAIISKSGQIESARAVSGPEMLRQAALDAIRNARYRPFLLNGSPTEVETSITVNFKLSS